MENQYQDTLDAIVRVLQSARSVLFVTGAGISADSGIPTYRGIGGLYEVDTTEDGLPIEAIMSGTMFRDNPELTWKYLGQIAESARGATYNRAHEVIALLETRLPRVWTLTQNVDGFHRMAGSRNVIEIHGNTRSLSCIKCRGQRAVDEQTELEIPPKCRDCGKMMRPDVVLFEESLPSEALAVYRREMETGFAAVFSVGTSSMFPYIQEPIHAAPRWGAPTIEINPAATVVTPRVDYHLPMGAAAAMDAIWERLQ